MSYVPRSQTHFLGVPVGGLPVCSSTRRCPSLSQTTHLSSLDDSTQALQEPWQRFVAAQLVVEVS